MKRAGRKKNGKKLKTKTVIEYVPGPKRKKSSRVAAGIIIAAVFAVSVAGFYIAGENSGRSAGRAEPAFSVSGEAGGARVTVLGESFTIKKKYKRGAVRIGDESLKKMRVLAFELEPAPTEAIRMTARKSAGYRLKIISALRESASVLCYNVERYIKKRI